MFYSSQILVAVENENWIDVGMIVGRDGHETLYTWKCHKKDDFLVS